jgi:rubrerythrin
LPEIRIDIILPVFYNDGSKIEDSKLLQTRKELTKRFGGCSVLRNTYGTWIDPSDDKEYNDVNSIFFTIAPKTQDTEDFLKEYKETLKARFNQKDIMITYQDTNRV